MHVRLDEASPPVEAEADLLVVGASFAGAALAYAVARAGLRVAVVEPRTYPGYEAAALLRTWITAPTRVPAVIDPWLADAASPTPQGELALHPDTMKIGLEDALLDAGVRFYYASQPCGVVVADGRVCGAVIGNKSGRQVILARMVADATELGTLARMACAPLRLDPLPAPVVARRTLEFTGITGDLPAALPMPARFGLAGDRAIAHRGYLGAEHAFIECPLRLRRTAPDLRGWMRLEIEARERTMDLAAHLVATHPAFGRAALAGSSWELHLAPGWHLEAPEAARRTVVVDGAVERRTLSVAAFADLDRSGLAVLGPGVAATPAEAEVLLEPLAAAQLGEALALDVAAILQARPLPDRERAIARCGIPTADDVPAELALREQPGPWRGHDYARVRAPAMDVPLLADAEVLVVGGGTSGAPAAAVAAASGVATAVVEMNCGLGGTGTLGGVDSYWFGRRAGITAEIDARYASEAHRLGVARDESAKWNIEARMHALLRWTTGAGADVFFRTTVVGAFVRGDAVRGVLLATPYGLRAARARVVIDASGDGDVAAFAGARYVYGSARDRLPMWYSLAQFARPGRTRNNFTSAVDVSNIDDYTRAILAGRRRGAGYDHGAYLAPRESRHILGGIVHTLTDQLTLRRFPDAIALCFSNSDIKGKSAADWVLWGLLPPNVESEIAYRAVVPEGLDGILVAGKAFSCTHDALPALRMQADLQNLGAACAVAALLALERGCEPRAIDVGALQRRLVERDILPAELLGRDLATPAPSDAELAALVDGLAGDEPFYIDMGFHDVQRELMLLVRAATAGPRIAPLLAAAYAQATGKRRLLLARLLAWYGSAIGVPCLIETLEGMLAGPELPARTAHVRYAGEPPDQGAMPEPCYLLYTLGMARDPRAIPLLTAVVDRLHPAPEDFRDRKGIFYYVDAICYVAERLGDPAAIPLLLALHAKDGLHGRRALAYEWDYFDERIAYLEVVIARALARCGAPEGAAILIDYLRDTRALLAEHAQDELMAISGRDFGKDVDAWRRWLAAQGAALEPHPWRGRID